MEQKKNCGKKEISSEESSELDFDIGVPSNFKVYTAAIIILMLCLSIVCLFLYGTHEILKSFNMVTK